jgi:hypothetical protein
MEKEIKEIIETLKAADNEATRAPYWLILDPRQMFRCDVHELGSMITGPFFSREDAEARLKGALYNYGKYAKVYCLSGCYSWKYEDLCKTIDKV